MLTYFQKESIRHVTFYDYAFKEKNGKAIQYNGKEFNIPSFEELKQSVFSEIFNLGFSKIKVVKPYKANCIIRVYQKLHYTYEFGGETDTYNLYGAHCYTLNNRKWITSAFQDDSEINYSKCIIKHWLFQDEYIDLDCDFVDYYVKIS